jgi:hypothetical protein
MGEIAPTTCPRCHNQVFLHHVSSDKQFSLYFIPLANYGATEYLLCPICKNGLQVKPNNRSAITSMGSATRLYRKGGLPAATYQAQVAKFWAQMGLDPNGTQVLQAAPTIPPPAAVGPDATPAAGGAPLADQLAQLGQLRDDGVLTDEEFATQKRRLLGS